MDESVTCPECGRIFIQVHINDYGKVWFASCICGYTMMDLDAQRDDLE